MLGYPINGPFATARTVFVWAFVLTFVSTLNRLTEDVSWDRLSTEQQLGAIGSNTVLALEIAVFVAATTFLSRCGVHHGRTIGLHLAAQPSVTEKLAFLRLALSPCLTFFGIFTLVGSVVAAAYYSWKIGSCDVIAVVGGFLYAGIPVLFGLAAEAAGIIEGLRDARFLAPRSQQLLKS